MMERASRNRSATLAAVADVERDTRDADSGSRGVGGSRQTPPNASQRQDKHHENGNDVPLGR